MDTMLDRTGITILERARRSRRRQRGTAQGIGAHAHGPAGILIATGGKPALGEPIPGLEHVITSNEAFDLKVLPRRIAIYGGGYIAVEFAGIFSGLGVDTTLVYRGDKILRGFDEDLRDALTQAYAKRGIRMLTQRTFRPHR